MRLMILPKLPLRTESGLMIVNVRLDIGRGLLHRGPHHSAAGSRGNCNREIDGEIERERRSLSWFGLHFDPPVMQLDEVPRQRQSEAGPAPARATSILGLIELLEDPLQ